MTKTLFIFLVGLLALTSCFNGDEPRPEPSGDTTLFMAVNGLPGFPDMIYDLEGNTIYECEEGGSIQSLVADGSDWYALISKENGTFFIVKNGSKILTGKGKVWCFTVQQGSIYTVQEYDNFEVWACKGWESSQDKGSWYSQQLFYVTESDLECVEDCLYNTFMVHDGSITMAFRGPEPKIMIDGSTFSLNEYLDHGFDHVYGIDFYAGYWLITYEDFETRKNMYWWKNVNYECPADFQPYASCIVNGHAFIIGQKIPEPYVGVIYGTPAVLIDGIETVLNDDLSGFSAVSLASHGMDTYILVRNNNTGLYSYIYKNLQAIELPDVKTPYSVGPYGSQNPNDGKSNLSALDIKAIAIVSNQKD